MKTLWVSSVVSLLSIASIASADRGYGSRGGDRYDSQRVQASIRYGQGSRNYDQTYGRYGQSTYGLRTDYDRDYGRRYSAGPRYYAGRPGNVGLSIGIGSSSYGDGVSFGFKYSSGPRYYDRGYYGFGSRYYGRPLIYAPSVYYAPPVYYAPAPVYYAPPVVYDRPYSPPSYYDNGGSTYYYESRSYYGR